MNPFRGLLDLLNIGKKPDDAPRPGEPAENPVPVLKDILAALKTAPAPSAPRPPMPTPPEKIQPTPPPAPAPSKEIQSPEGWAAYVESLKPKPPAASQPQGPPPTSPPAPVSAVASSAPPAPSAPAPNVNVSPPAVNVTTPAASHPAAGIQPTKGEGQGEGILSSAVGRLGELFSSFTGTLADLVGKVTGIPGNAAATPTTTGPGQPATPAGTPPAPTGTGAGQQPPTVGNPPPGNTGQGPPEQPKEPEGEKKPRGFLDSIGGFTKLAGVISLVTGVFGKTISVVKSFVMGTHAANEELRFYSGQLAVAFANLDIQKIQQNMQTAQATGASGSNLASEIKNMRDELQPLREMSTTFKNKLAANFVASTAATAKIANDMAQILGLVDIAKDIEKNTRDRSRDNRTPGVRVASELASGEWRNIGNQQPLPPIQ